MAQKVMHGQMRGESDQGGVVAFSASQAVAAIAFHLVDEGIATEVRHDSMRRIVTRLERSGFSVVKSKDQWAAMTNAGRLNWLLEQCHVQPEAIGGGRAVLTCDTQA